MVGDTRAPSKPIRPLHERKAFGASGKVCARYWLSYSPLLSLSPWAHTNSLSSAGTSPNVARNAIVNCAELVTYDLIKDTLLKANLMTGMLGLVRAGERGESFSKDHIFSSCLPFAYSLYFSPFKFTLYKLEQARLAKRIF